MKIERIDEFEDGTKLVYFSEGGVMCEHARHFWPQDQFPPPAEDLFTTALNEYLNGNEGEFLQVSMSGEKTYISDPKLVEAVLEVRLAR